MCRSCKQSSAFVVENINGVQINNDALVILFFIPKEAKKWHLLLLFSTLVLLLPNGNNMSEQGTQTGMVICRFFIDF